MSLIRIIAGSVRYSLHFQFKEGHMVGLVMPRHNDANDDCITVIELSSMTDLAVPRTPSSASLSASRFC